jgi:hypothetical protein
MWFFWIVGAMSFVGGTIGSIGCAYILYKCATDENYVRRLQDGAPRDGNGRVWLG